MKDQPNSEILRELTKEELLGLVELYRSKNDRYHCMSIYNHCRWNTQLNELGEKDHFNWRQMQKTFYTHRNGDLALNGTYISLERDVILSIQFHTLEESLHELKECLTQTKLIDWTAGPMLTAIHTDLSDELMDLIAALGAVFQCEIPCTCFTLAPSVALELLVPKVPEGYEMLPLEGKHASLVYANWPHRNEASVDFIQGMIDFNITLGIFRVKDNQLVAWIFQNEFYGLGILQVIPEEQGKGFAKLLAREISKKIAMQDSNDITAFAVVGNVKSEGILKNIGFKEHCVTKWIQFKQLCDC